MTGSKKENLGRGYHHHHMIGTSYLFRAEGNALKNSLILSEGDGGGRGMGMQQLLSDKTQ